MSYISDLYTTQDNQILSQKVAEQEATLTNGCGWGDRPYSHKIFKFFHYWLLRDRDLRTIVRSSPDDYTKANQIVDINELREKVYQSILGPEAIVCPHGISKKFKNTKYVFTEPCRHCNSESVRLSKSKESSEKKAKTSEKRIDTTLKRYGVENPMKNTEFKNKAMSSASRKRGTQEYTNAQEKRKKTLIEKYRVDNFSKTQKFRDYLSANNPMYSDESKARLSKTMKERYDISDMWQLGRDASYEKYNGNPFAATEVKEKIKKSNLEKFGVEHFSQTRARRDFMKEHGAKYRISAETTFLRLFNSKSPWSDPDVRKKCSLTMREKYGFTQKHLPKETIRILHDKELFMNTFGSLDAYTISTELNVHITTIYSAFARFGIVLPPPSNRGEEEICDWLDSIGIEFIRRDRNIISPKEIDILVPSHTLAIEFNGDYWHSHIYKDSKYHRDKFKMIAASGHKCLMIYEHEWHNRKNAVKSLILSKLGLTKRGASGREVSIRKIAHRSEAVPFLEQFHLQGSVNGVISLGAFHNDTLVAVMSFRKSNKLDGIELCRYASDMDSHPGVFSKLLKVFDRMYAPESIITYSDNRYTDGAVYVKNGFIKEKDIDAEDYFLIGNQLLHNDYLRKSTVEKIFDVKLTTSVLEFLLSKGIFRIWDCGKVRFIRKMHI